MVNFKYLLLKVAQTLLGTLALQGGFTSKERTLTYSNISFFFFSFSFVVEVLFDSTDTSFAFV